MNLEYINHYTAVRLRVTGTGNLDLTLFSYGENRSLALTSPVMSLTTDRTPTALANFKGQACKLRISTNEIDEVFNISQVVIYSKPVESSYPQ